jgi:hypothetical protein
VVRRHATRKASPVPHIAGLEARLQRLRCCLQNVPLKEAFGQWVGGGFNVRNEPRERERHYADARLHKLFKQVSKCMHFSSRFDFREMKNSKITAHSSATLGHEAHTNFRENSSVHLLTFCA